jgi:ribonuclease VapC
VSNIYVLDSSAFLAMLNGESGSEKVEAALPLAVIGAVNISEIVAKLRDNGLSKAEVDETLALFTLDVRPLTQEQAARAGHMRDATRPMGLSLGDRACLALAVELDAIALTADREWQNVDPGVLGKAVVELIR